MTPQDYLDAARVPASVPPQSWDVWYIDRRPAPPDRMMRAAGHDPVGYDDYTLLMKYTDSTLMKGGHVVMDDSAPELRKHLQIWMHAYGRVLLTGLGLGCVVRGLLASPTVGHIDVIEIEDEIIQRVGGEFADNPKVSIIHGDALTCDVPGHWDVGWHDIYCDDNEGLQTLHAKLIKRFRDRCTVQGAWAFPSVLRRRARNGVML